MNLNLKLFDIFRTVIQMNIKRILISMSLRSIHELEHSVKTYIQHLFIGQINLKQYMKESKTSRVTLERFINTSYFKTSKNKL